VKEFLRAMRKLRHEVLHVLLDLRPIFHPAMQLEHVLAHPAPQLLNGVEPGSIGRQPYRLDQGVARLHLQHVGVGVNVPVILMSVIA
jgi:hypothetical protein